MQTTDQPPNYSGFSTLNQQLTYEKFVSKTINVMSLYVLSFLKGEADGVNWPKKIMKLYRALAVMEKSKLGSAIRFSQEMKELVYFLFENKDANSNMSFETSSQFSSFTGFGTVGGMMG